MHLNIGPHEALLTCSALVSVSTHFGVTLLSLLHLHLRALLSGSGSSPSHRHVFSQKRPPAEWRGAAIFVFEFSFYSSYFFLLLDC